MRKKFSLKFFPVFIVIFIALTVFSVFSIVTINNNELPFLFGHASVQIVTDSMSPSYNRGDVVTVEKVDHDELHKGDVICFRSSDPDIYGSLNTHRIYAVEAGEDGELCFVTKGDNASKVDDYKVAAGDVVGKVTGKNTLFSNIMALLRNKFGFLAVIVIPMFAILSISIKQFAAAVADYSNSKVGEDTGDSTTKEE